MEQQQDRTPEIEITHTVEIYRQEGGGHRGRIVTSNGEITWQTSEDVTNKATLRNQTLRFIEACRRGTVEIVDVDARDAGGSDAPTD